jgi:hypothetical protein
MGSSARPNQTHVSHFRAEVKDRHTGLNPIQQHITLYIIRQSLRAEMKNTYTSAPPNDLATSYLWINNVALSGE